jgi:peptide subunit release factor 1 (eRF1)
MIDQAALQELLDFHAVQENAPVLSLYLHVDPRQRNTEQYKLALRHMLDSVSEQVDHRDRERVERFVEIEYDRRSRGLACFSCAAEDFWQVYPLMVPVKDWVFAGHRPYLKPLGDVLDTFARYGVVLVDQEGAHIFTFHLGTLQDVSGVVGEEIKRHKQGGWAASRYQRHEDAAAYRNLKEAAEMTAQVVRGGQVRHLILAGTDGNVAQFESLLPKAVRQVVMGSFGADMSEGPAGIGEKSLKLIWEATAQRKEELVDELITAAAKEGPATLGLADTLRAAYAGRAHHLILEDSFAVPAYRCDHCGYVGVEDLDVCPSCGNDLRVLPDAADSLVRWALAQDIDLTVVSDNAKLVDAGGVGAFLRY